jgi:NAD(P)H-hydrate epimerase
MSWFPQRLFTVEELRAAEQLACEALQLDERGLMERAGGAAFAFLRERWPRAHRLAVVCGTGNNGGDGYVLARHARNAGLAVEVLEVEPNRPRARVAADARTAFVEFGGAPHPFHRDALETADLVVDAVFGIGLRQAPGGAHASAIAAINAVLKPVLALDCPSGLDADTGRAPGVAVHAAATVVFIGLKRGLLTCAGPDLAGELALRTLDAPLEALGRSSAATLSEFEVRTALQERARDTHKGDYGAVLVVGGDHGMGGAALLAAEAALRVGTGLVRLATRPAHVGPALARRPELMVTGIDAPEALEPLIARSSVIAIGPGLGRDGWGAALWSRCVAAGKPLVVDADALGLLAASGAGPRSDWILTPHPGEAARLLGVEIGEVQADRFAAAQRLRERFGGVQVLKGSGSLVLDGQSIGVCDVGNPGMATAGMGDVLTGIIAGLRAQGLDASGAARVGTWLHAAAGDAAAGDGERGLIASDLFPALRRLLDPA